MLSPSSFASLKLAAAVLGFTVAFGGGWAWRSSIARADEATTASALAESNGEAQRKINAAHTHDADALRAIADQAQIKLKGAQDETNRLRDCMRRGTCGLHLHASCSAGLPATITASGVGTGGGAQLDADAERNYFALRDAIQRTETKLSACQGSLRELTTAQ